MSDTNVTSTRDSLWLRLLWMVIIGALTSVAQTLLGLMAVIQLIIMALNKSTPNAEIAGFGKRMGLWLGKAARFQTAASEEKPWPWSPLD
jgi:hypothetical protein